MKYNIASKCSIVARLLLLALVTFAALFVTSKLTHPKDNRRELGMVDAKATGFMTEPKDSIDVLFMGDSLAYASFNTLLMWEEQGFTSYVIATPGQKLPQGESLLKEALHFQKPKLVVIEVHELFMGFSSDSELMRAIQEVLPVFEYHDAWKHLMPLGLFSPAQTTWVNPTKGYQKFDMPEPPDPAGAPEESEMVSEISAKNRTYLTRILARIREAGATPVFVSVPSLTNWSEARRNTMLELSSEAGVDFYDFNHESLAVRIDWATDSSDHGDHLNSSGAAKFASVLGEKLSSRYELPDHRGDSAYSNWDTFCQEFAAENNAKHSHGRHHSHL